MGVVGGNDCPGNGLGLYCECGSLDERGVLRDRHGHVVAGQTQNVGARGGLVCVSLEEFGERNFEIEFLRILRVHALCECAPAEAAFERIRVGGVLDAEEAHPCQRERFSLAALEGRAAREGGESGGAVGHVGRLRVRAVPQRASIVLHAPCPPTRFAHRYPTRLLPVRVRRLRGLNEEIDQPTE